MEIGTSATNLRGETVLSVLLKDVPDVCPLCHHAIVPQLVHVLAPEGQNIVQAVYRCVREGCQQAFVATYARGPKDARGSQALCVLVDTQPRTPEHSEFPPTVVETSPTFVEIYDQVLAAEAAGLTQLVGIGLRKALEFLVKDYLASQQPEQADAIRSSQLGACIAQRVVDANVKACAARAAWLGNDETHYNSQVAR